MTDLSSLSADQLTENVRDSLGGPDYAPMDRRWEDVAADAEANLAELQTRANQHDEAVRRMVTLRAKVAAAEKEAGIQLGRAAGAELERDRLAARAEAAEARLAETLKALERIEWCWDEGAGENICPDCGLSEKRGHDRSCRLGAALTTHLEGKP